MVTEAISVREMLYDVQEMLLTCFEGKITATNGALEITFENGQRFVVSLEELS